MTTIKQLQKMSDNGLQLMDCSKCGRSGFYLFFNEFSIRVKCNKCIHFEKEDKNDKNM